MSAPFAFVDHAAGKAPPGESSKKESPGESSKKESQATTIVRLAREEQCELWHTAAGDGYISIPVQNHQEHHSLTSRGSRDFLSHLYFSHAGKAPNASALQDAIATLSGLARFDGDEHDVHVRLAGDDTTIYLDLCDPHWQVVHITAKEWRIVTDAPVRFRRPRGVLPLPVPQRGGSLKKLRSFLNVATDRDFVLLVMWVLAALRPRGPYPIVIFTAEQGAAKTTSARVLRRLCDPNEADLRRPPRNTEDLMIAATNGHVVAFDNLSKLSDELSDNLSVLATGGGFAVRQLYTNNEEMIFKAQRPILLNGISQIATRGDLLDRAIVTTLPPISEKQRRDEAAFWREFDLAHPRLLGAFLDAIVVGLQRLSVVKLERKPRMADFALWGVATEPACPWTTGTFLRVYAGNRRSAIDDLLEGDPIADLARALVPWIGTATEFLTLLNQRTPEEIRRRKEWYTTPRQIADGLRRLAPALRRVGAKVDFVRQPRSRLIRLKKVGSSASSASPRSSAPTPAPGTDRNNGSYHTPAQVVVVTQDDAGDADKHPFSDRRRSRTDQVQDQGDANFRKGLL